MNAGLPTTGIGGIFYFLCVFTMFFVEIFRTITKQSSRRQWKFVVEQLAMLASMLGMIWLTGFILLKLTPQSVRQIVAFGSADTPAGESIQTIFLVPFIILGVLLVMTQIFRAYILLSRKTANNNVLT